MSMPSRAIVPPPPRRDVDSFDTDSTLELPSADRTMANLRALSADGTQELEGGDILEVAVVSTRLPPLNPLPKVAPPPRRARAEASVIVANPFLQPHYPLQDPPSIAPFALDVQTSPSARPPAASTMEIRRASGLSASPRLQLLAAAAAGAFTMLIVAGGVLMIGRHESAVSQAQHAAAAPPPVVATPREPDAIPAPPEAQAVDDTQDPPPAADGPLSTPTYATAAHAAVTASRPRGPRTGTLLFPATLRGALVDGAPHRIEGGGLHLTCGKHTIKTPAHPPRRIDVPCGGSVSY